MGPRLTKKVTEQLEVESQTLLTKLTTDWVLIYPQTKARLATEIRAIAGLYSHKAEYRTADVSPDFPNAWIQSGNAATSANGVVIEDFSSVPGGKLWIQGGIAAAATGPGTGEALASVQMMTGSLGEIVARESVLINPDLNAAATSIYPIGKPFAALGLSGIIMAYVASGSSGTTTFQPQIRYLTRLDQPGAWANVTGSAAINIAADTMANTGDLPFTPAGTDLYAQVGIAVTAVGRVNLDFVCAARY